MLSKTKEEIVEFCKTLWHDREEDYHSNPNIEVGISKDRYDITIERSYNPPGLSLKQLMALSEFFQTTNINDDAFNYSGCDTCDYGSSYGFTLTVRKDV